MVEGQQESTLTKVAGHSLHVGVVPLGAVNVWPAVGVNEQLTAVPALHQWFLSTTVFSDSIIATDGSSTKPDVQVRCPTAVQESMQPFTLVPQRSLHM